MKAKTTKEVLIAAKWILENTVWCQKSFYQTKKGEHRFDISEATDVSLPLLPFMIVMIPFAHWVTQPDGVPPTKLTLMYFLTLSATMSLFAYLISIILWLS